MMAIPRGSRSPSCWQPLISDRQALARRLPGLSPRSRARRPDENRRPWRKARGRFGNLIQHLLTHG
jgi:hypothetical protein